MAKPPRGRGAKPPGKGPRKGSKSGTPRKSTGPARREKSDAMRDLESLFQRVKNPPPVPPIGYEEQHLGPFRALSADRREILRRVRANPRMIELQKRYLKGKIPVNVPGKKVFVLSVGFHQLSSGNETVLGRPIVGVLVNGRSIFFYRSSGMNGQRRRWFPIPFFNHMEGADPGVGYLFKTRDHKGILPAWVNTISSFLSKEAFVGRIHFDLPTPDHSNFFHYMRVVQSFPPLARLEPMENGRFAFTLPD